MLSSTPSRRRRVLALFAGLLCAVSLGAAAQTPYHFTALHGPGGTDGIARDLNGHGAIVGYGHPEDAHISHAMLWRRNAPLDLHQLGVASIASGVNRLNEDGVITGVTIDEWHPALWQEGTAALLPTLGGNLGGANAINNAGHIVGYSALAGNTAYHATRWTGGQPFDMGTLGGVHSSANAVNALGDAAGYADAPGNVPHAALWTADGDLIDLGTLGGQTSQATSINRRRWVAGYSEVPAYFTTHAALWHDGVAIDLGTLGEGRNSFAWGIDAEGTVVGYSHTTNHNHMKDRRATLWRDGLIIDLNSWLDDATRAAGWVLLEARAINEDGVITGLAKNSITGKERAFRLTPP
ncbi:hypothetical protein [Ideonella sp.]|uniref:hypothetical protein n=1 Tax=Ideonella sp. TaxID=1929293 RepID=UPI0035AE6B5A